MWERLSNERCQRRIVTRGKRLKMSAVSVLSRPRQVGRTPDVLHDPVSYCHVHMSGPFRSTLWPGINHKMIMYIPSWPSVLICLEPHTRIAGPISKLEYSSIIIMIIFFFVIFSKPAHDLLTISKFIFLWYFLRVIWTYCS